MDTLRSKEVLTKQQRIAELARRLTGKGLTSLNHYIDAQWLKEAYARTKKDKAAGVDGVTATEYECNFESNIASLVDRLKSGSYKAPPVKRCYIPKEDGRQKRPIGIPTLEDKIAQRAMSILLEPIFEEEFLDCSYGFRPRRSVHQALEAMWQTANRYRHGWILEVDIQKYFDTIDHQHLRTFYKERIHDGVLRRILGKWLKAGVMEDGNCSYPTMGTPQGGVISPLLSNIYLHNVLDRWFENEIKPQLCGQATLIRFADDFVILFENRNDAYRVNSVIPKRFGKYGLTLHPEKTRLLYFGVPSQENRKSDTFDFLGFTHYWGKSRKGNWIPKRKTAKGRLKRAVRSVYVWCKENRHMDVSEQWKTLRRKVNGHYNFYGITFNSEGIGRFYEQVKRSWRKWLNRRDRIGNMPWVKFNKLLDRYPLPKPRIVHSYVV